MSTTTIQITDTPNRVERARLREQERAARAAARRREGLARQEKRYDELQQRCDLLRTQLPDLVMSLPPFPTDAGSDPVVVRGWVDHLERQLDAAIKAARAALEERNRREKAWAAFHETRDAVVTESALCVALARSSAAEFRPPAPVAAPPPDAPAEVVAAATGENTRLLERLRSERASLETRQRVYANVRAVAGGAAGTAARSAAAAVDAQVAQRSGEQKRQIRAAIDAALSANRFTSHELPEVVRSQIDSVVEQGLDPRPVVDALGRRRSRLDQSEDARRLLHTPPEVLDEVLLAQRWNQLAARLDRVATGLVPWDPGLEQTWHQLHRDSAAAAAAAFARARFLAEAQAQGLNLVDGAEQGLLLMDLDGNGDYWLETRQESLPDGRVATVAELHASPRADPSLDQAATEKACAMMTRLSATRPGQTTVQEVERTGRVKRRERPAARSLSKHFND